MQWRVKTLHTGAGVVDLDGSDAGLVDASAVVEELQALFGSRDYKPPLPPAVAAEVLALSRAREVDLPKVAALLEKDALLAGTTLRTAQSPRYVGDRPVQTLREAVVRLGARGVHDVVLEAALSLRVFKTSNPALQDQMNRLRRHVVAVATAARRLSQYTALEADHAFLCGLLHDVGIAAGLIAIGDHPQRFGTPSAEALASALGAIHEDAAGIVGRAWQVSPDVLWVVSHHHTLKSDGFAHPMVATLIVAEDLAIAAGYSADGASAVVRVDAAADASVDAARAVLGLRDKTWDVARRDVEAALAQLQL